MQVRQTRLYLVRHGEVEKSWRGRIYGCRDVELSDRGKMQAETVGDLLSGTQIAGVVSSHLARAVFGADQIAAGRPLQRQEDEALREIDRGAWVGRLPEELNAAEGGAWHSWHRAPATIRPPDGETLTEVAQRVLPRIAFWARRFEAQSVAIVAHSWVLRVTLCAALGLPLERAGHLQLDTGSLSIVDWALPAVGESPTLRHTVLGIGLDRVPAPADWFQAPKAKVQIPADGRNGV